MGTTDPAELFNTHPLLLTARSLATIATAVMSEYRGHLTTATVAAKNNPNDLVTQADATIEALVRGYLADVRPKDAVIGEEGTQAQRPCLEDFPNLPELHAAELRAIETAGASAAELGPLEWHVDPIDGTVNFVRGIEHHCFSVGARRRSDAHPAQSEFEVGLVAAPVLGEVWFAVRGKGAFKTNLAGTSAPVRLAGTPESRRGRVVATGFGYAKETRDLQLDRFAAVMERFDDVRRMGSAAIDLCQAAEGRVNAYYERGLGVYDWAAGALIAREAGLFVQTPAERYGQPVIAAGSREDFEFLRTTA